MINIGIIGCGSHAETIHLPVLSRLGGVCLHSACDTRSDRLRLVERAFRIPRLYQDCSGMIADADLDAVLIATPGDSHVPLTAAALAAGKHVLVEKPLALTVADAESLAATARDGGVVSMVGFNYRFHPLARELKTTVSRGAIGRPLAVFATQMSGAGQGISVTGYETSPERGGGVFHNKVVHAIDLLRFLFDCEVVHARAAPHWEVPRHTAAVELALSNGVRVLGYFSYRAISDMTWLVIGDEGKAAVNFARPAGVALFRREFSRSRVAKLFAYARQAPRIVSAIRLSTRAGRLSSYRNEWEHFLACIESGGRAKPDFDDGLAVTRTIAQLLDSLGESTEAALDPAPWGSAGDVGRRPE